MPRNLTTNVEFRDMIRTGIDWTVMLQVDLGKETRLTTGTTLMRHAALISPLASYRRDSVLY
jgi:hypothetical protein